MKLSNSLERDTILTDLNKSLDILKAVPTMKIKYDTPLKPVNPIIQTLKKEEKYNPINPISWHEFDERFRRKGKKHFIGNHICINSLNIAI